MDQFDKIKNQVNKGLFEAINKALEFSKQKIEEKTPEDTKTLLGNYQIEEAKEVGGKVVGKITNDTEYGFYVENGVRDRVYNYNKPKGTIFRVGVGAKMMKRTEIEDFQDIEKIVSNITIKVTEKGNK